MHLYRKKDSNKLPRSQRVIIHSFIVCKHALSCHTLKIIFACLRHAGDTTQQEVFVCFLLFEGFQGTWVPCFVSLLPPRYCRAAISNQSLRETHSFLVRSMLVCWSIMFLLNRHGRILSRTVQLSLPSNLSLRVILGTGGAYSSLLLRNCGRHYGYLHHHSGPCGVG